MVDTRLCDAHFARWVAHGQPHGGAFDSWCRTQPAIWSDVSGQVDLRGIDENLRYEFLFGIQRAALEGRRTKLPTMRSAVNILAKLDISSLRTSDTLPDRRPQGKRNDGEAFLVFTSTQLTLAVEGPNAQYARDVWDLPPFGISGRLSFAEITQPWLREAAKAWATRRIPTIRSMHPSTLRDVVVPLRHLSRCLARRMDGGLDLRRLSHTDVETFTSELAIDLTKGKLSDDFRSRVVEGVDRFFRQAREWGLMAPGGPLAGLPDSFQVLRTDVPVFATDRRRKRQSIPEEVMDQLFTPQSLDVLERSSSPQFRRWIELQADVGRRPGEVCNLHWDCLAYDERHDETGKVTRLPVLVVDMPKSNIYGYRLPISRSTEEIVLAQQEYVRQRFPSTPADELVLFPATQRPQGGRRALGRQKCGVWVQQWVAARPEPLTISDSLGNKHLFTGTIVAYSFRHTYAQRLADAGTPVEVLAELMGHRQISSSQAYCDVSEGRQRRAIELVAPLQLNANGVRARVVGQILSESEAVREHLGYVAVPFGGCTEPSNVRAHGRACPFRHRCFGCVHFRTDPSYLPELADHLTGLLADKERLAVAAELTEWARSEAAPSDEEIGAVRNLVRSCEGLLGELTEGERAAVEEAIAELRRHRAQLNTSVPIELRRRVRQEAPSTTAFPRAATDAEGRTAR